MGFWNAYPGNIVKDVGDLVKTLDTEHIMDVRRTTLQNGAIRLNKRKVENREADQPELLNLSSPLIVEPRSLEPPKKKRKVKHESIQSWNYEEGCVV